MSHRYLMLSSWSTLSAADLPRCAVELAKALDDGRKEIAVWLRALTLALFDRYGMKASDPRRAVAEAHSGDELLRRLGVVTLPEPDDALGRAWEFHRRVDMLPAMAAGFIDGHPYKLTVQEALLPAALQPMAREVTEALLEHAALSDKLTEKLDRAIVALWGCPLDRLEERLKVSDLEGQGLELRTFDP